MYLSSLFLIFRCFVNLQSLVADDTSATRPLTNSGTRWYVHLYILIRIVNIFPRTRAENLEARYLKYIRWKSEQIREEEGGEGRSGFSILSRVKFQFQRGKPLYSFFKFKPLPPLADVAKLVHQTCRHDRLRRKTEVEEWKANTALNGGQRRYIPRLAAIRLCTFPTRGKPTSNP